MTNGGFAGADSRLRSSPSPATFRATVPGATPVALPAGPGQVWARHSSSAVPSTGRSGRAGNRVRRVPRRVRCASSSGL